MAEDKHNLMLSEKLGIMSIVVAILVFLFSTIVTVTIPEIRKLVGLKESIGPTPIGPSSKPASIPVSAPSSVPPGNSSIKHPNDAYAHTGMNGNNLFPLTAGRTWTYSVGSQTVKYIARGQVKFHGTTAYQLDLGSGESNFYNYTSSGVVSVGSADTVSPIDQIINSPPVLYLPLNMTAGYTWTQNFAQMSYDANGLLQTTTNFRATMLVVGIETITVPGGTFNNAVHLKDTETSDHMTGTTTSEVWLVAGVGIVKLINPDSDTLRNAELKSYTQ